MKITKLNKLTPKKLVVFDLDGTLAWSKSVIDKEMVELLKELLSKKKVAVIGGGLWILLVVGSLLFGKKLDGGAESSKPTPIPDQSVAAKAVGSGAEEHVPVPGTVVLAMTLLTAFVLYYFINWKYLSTLWGLS